jgi:hypothetical protein
MGSVVNTDQLHHQPRRAWHSALFWLLVLDRPSADARVARRLVDLRPHPLYRRGVDRRRLLLTSLASYALYLCRLGALQLLNCLVGLLTLVVLVSGVTGCASFDQPAAAEKVSVRDLLVTPAWFDGRLVAVSGQVSAPRLEVSGRGPTYSFRLDDGTQVIDVRAMGGPVGCQATQRVAVEGWFRAAPLGTGFGSIEAIRVVCQ